jgi:hypothetical protein
MAESHVVSGLVAKYSELSGLFQHHQEVMRQIASDLDHLTITIKLFDPELDLRTIKVTNHRHSNTWFEHGETNRMVLDALRSAAAPLSTRQIGEAMVAVKGMTVNGTKEWDSVLKLVLGAAQRLERKGVIKMVGRVDGSPRGAMIWQLV